jgi:phosphoribosylanthranilate isomerase
MKVKVCGMKHNITEVAGLQPDYMGFIFWEASPRYFDGTLPPLQPHLKKVGVFVNASIPVILEKTQRYGLRLVQLHGSESPKYCRELRERLQFGQAREQRIEIIKVFSVKDSFDFNLLIPYEANCDYFLFDTRGKLPGGNGYAFDWHLLTGYPSQKPYFLSGGIGPEDLPKLAEFLKRPESEKCHAIDVNSRFESDPGRKNADQLTKFINAEALRH